MFLPRTGPLALGEFASAVYGLMFAVYLDVSEDPPCPNLERGTLTRFHVDAVIPEERGSACGHPGASRDIQPDISHQVEDAKDRSFPGGPVAQVHLHVT